MNRRPFIQVLLGLLGLRAKPDMQPFLDYTRKALRERFQTNEWYVKHGKLKPEDFDFREIPDQIPRIKLEDATAADGWFIPL